jgi:hypothetical protein
LRVAGILAWFWRLRGHLREGRHWLGAVLAASREVRTPLRVRALNGLGLLTYSLGDTIPDANNREHAVDEADRSKALCPRRDSQVCGSRNFKALSGSPDSPALALSARSAGPHLLLVVLVNVRRETGGAQLRVAREPAVEPVDAERREGRRTLAASDDPARQVLTDGR